MISFPSASMTQNNTLLSSPHRREYVRAHLHIITISIWWHVNAVVAVLAVYSRAHLRLPPACFCARHRHPAIVQSPSLSFAPYVRHTSFSTFLSSLLCTFSLFLFLLIKCSHRITTYKFSLPRYAYKDA